MHPCSDTQDNRHNRLRAIEHTLKALKAAATDQKAFFNSAALTELESEISSSVRQLARRMDRLNIAGDSWLFQMEKSFLGDVLRMTILARHVTDDAATEAWPELVDEVGKARSLLEESARENPSYFSFEDWTENSLLRATACPDAPSDDWKLLSPYQIAAVRQPGITLLVTALGNSPSSNKWVAYLGGVSIGIRSTSVAAMEHAEKEYSQLLSDVPPK